MAVALDAAGTGKTGTAATSTGSIAAGITVGAGSSVLVLGIQFSGDPGTITTCNWDSGGTPQAMTQVGTLQLATDSLSGVELFGLVAPRAGTLNISIAWTNSRTWTFGLLSFTGGDQTSVATACINFVKGQSASTGVNPSSFPTGGATINSPVGDFCVLFGAGDLIPFITTSGDGTNQYALNTNVSGFGRYKTGAGASTSIAGADSDTTANHPGCYAGCDIAVVSAAAPAGGDTSVGVFGGFSSVIRVRRIVGY